MNCCAVFNHVLEQLILQICFSQLTDMMLNGGKNTNDTQMILIDVQKAVDTLDHTNLLDKIKMRSFFT